MPYTQLVDRVVTRRRRRSLRQTVRAVFRNYWALWHEFRVPILFFLFVTIGGGYLYGELHMQYYPDEVIPLIDRPYFIFQMMILESPPLTTPREPHLIAFWYVMPAVFVYVIALGAADFLRLFFNPSERQDAWMEALASTYRHHIIVMGAGHVGMRVIAELIQMDYEVVALDNQPDPGVEDALKRLHVPLILGDGRNPSLLEKAGLRHASAFVACTGNDHANLETVMRVREMNKDIRVVVRVWEEQFVAHFKQFMNVQSALSSSELSAPAFAGAALGIEITQTLKVGDKEYSTIRLMVEKSSFMDGETVGKLQTQEDMDIVLLQRDEMVDVQPPRDIVVQAGDTLVIFALHDCILSIASRNRPKKR